MIERKMITYYLIDLIKAKEVMVPRQDMVAIDIGESVDSYLDDDLYSPCILKFQCTRKILTISLASFQLLKARTI